LSPSFSKRPKTTYPYVRGRRKTVVSAEEEVVGII
jgi:hypothetical protein